MVELVISIKNEREDGMVNEGGLLIGVLNVPFPG